MNSHPFILSMHFLSLMHGWQFDITFFFGDHFLSKYTSPPTLHNCCLIIRTFLSGCQSWSCTLDYFLGKSENIAINVALSNVDASNIDFHSWNWRFPNCVKSLFTLKLLCQMRQLFFSTTFQAPTRYGNIGNKTDAEKSLCFRKKDLFKNKHLRPNWTNCFLVGSLQCHIWNIVNNHHHHGLSVRAAIRLTGY